MRKMQIFFEIDEFRNHKSVEPEGPQPRPLFFHQLHFNMCSTSIDLSPSTEEKGLV